MVAPASLGVRVPLGGVGLGHRAITLAPRIDGVLQNGQVLLAQPAGWMRAPPALSFPTGLGGLPALASEACQVSLVLDLGFRVSHFERISLRLPSFGGAPFMDLPVTVAVPDRPPQQLAASWGAGDDGVFVLTFSLLELQVLSLLLFFITLKPRVE